MRGKRGTIVVVVALAGILSAQTKPAPKPSLEETVAWMNNFSQDHGFLAHGSTFIRENHFLGKGCAALIEADFPGTKNESNKVKKSTAGFDLGDLDPNIRIENDNNDGSFMIRAERTDAETKIHEMMEYGDGHKSEGWSADEVLFFDTKEAGQRFAKAFSHAVALCGGKSAPF